MILDLGVEDEDPVAAEAFGGAGEFVGALVGDGRLRGLGSGSWVEPGGFQVWAFEFGEVDLELAAPVVPITEAKIAPINNSKTFTEGFD